MKEPIESILDHLGDTGIYVIRADDHRILYFNERVRRVKDFVAVGMVCDEVWSGECTHCPLLTIGDRQTNTTINYNDSFGDVVDITATRIDWGEEGIPAFVIAVYPHVLSREEEAARNQREHLEYQLNLLFDGLNKLFGEFIILNLESGQYVAYKSDDSMDRITVMEPKDFALFNKAYGELLIHPRDQKLFFDAFKIENIRKSVSSGQRAIQAEVRRKDAKGEYRWCEMILTILNRQNPQEDQCALLTFRDIHNLRQQLRDAIVTARQANDAKTDFLLRMSHDIRTPMNAIIGMTNIAKKHPEDVDRVVDCLGKIDISSRHLLMLINEILDMSSIESGKMTLEENYFCLDDLMIDTVSIIRQSVLEKKHSIHYYARNFQDSYVVGDYGRLERILLNLLSNSVKYTPEGGRIEVTMEQLSPEQKHIGDDGKAYGLFRLSVKDNGIGMSKAFLNRLFEPFERGDTVWEQNAQGTGLGMTIVKRFVEMMHGSVSVESEPDKGTCIAVTLRLELDVVELADPVLAGRRVLVVESCPGEGRKVLDAFNHLGMTGDVVCDGRSVTEYMNDSGKSYDVYAVNWQITGEDSIDIVRDIRSCAGGKPVILLMSYEWCDIAPDAKAAGVDAFVTKPANARKLGPVTASWLRERQQHPARASQGFKGKRILLVEDNALNREIAMTMLDGAGFSLECAGDGSEAVEMFERSRIGYYDAVLMDIQMPIMDGYEATRKIRRLPRRDGTVVPIIAMSANAFRRDVKKSLECGMNDHVAKPVDFEKLCTLLMSYM